MFHIRKTNKQFKKELKRVLPNLTPLEKYTTNNTKILVRCVCGVEKKIVPSTLLMGMFRCDCWIKPEIKKYHGNKIKFLGRVDYNENKHMGRFKCRVCGNKWITHIYSVAEGVGCPRCARKAAGISNRLSDSEILTRLETKYGDTIKFFGRSKKDPSLCKLKCVICGYKWTTHSKYLFQTGCLKCSQKVPSNKRSDKQIQVKLDKVYKGKVKFLGRSEEDSLYGIFECTQCNRNWEAFIGSTLAGHGCVNCSKYNLKPFKLGGKVVHLQGYEPQALKWLRDNTNLKPEDVVAGDVDKIPMITYFDTQQKKLRNYYPDFYIPKENTVVEVKSDFTFLDGLRNLKDKKEGVEDSGYQFSLMVMNHDNNRFRVPDNWFNLKLKDIFNELRLQ